MKDLQDFISKQFGVDEQLFLQALLVSPSAQGYILGAISEFFLRVHFTGRRRRGEPPSSADSTGENDLRRGAKGGYLTGFA